MRLLSGLIQLVGSALWRKERKRLVDGLVFLIWCPTDVSGFGANYWQRHDKLRVTVMLTGRSDIFKCQPYVLLSRKRIDPAIIEKFKGKLQLAWEGTTWMNDELTADYLRSVMGNSLSLKHLLVWDSFRCHISNATKKQLKQCGLDTALVTGRCTKFIQVCVCFNLFALKAIILLLRFLTCAGTCHSSPRFVSSMKTGCSTTRRK